MSRSTQQPNTNNSGVSSGWLFALVLIASLTAVSNQSLWIDEAITAWQASLPDLKSCWRQMIADRGSELQMPLFMAYLWVWERLVGTSEFSLRLSNLPWLLLGFGALLKAFSGEKKLRMGVALATVLSPFVWFYLNEARPYVMQLGGSFLVFAALYRLGSAIKLSPSLERRWSTALAAGMLIVCASSMLGVLWVGAALASALICIGPKRIWELAKAFRMVWLITLTALLVLGAYYLWTLRQGARASGAAGTNLANLVFIAYEFLGFAGLGPGRLELRQLGLRSLAPYAPLFVIYAFTLAAVLIMGWRGRIQLASTKCLFWPVLLLIATATLLLLMAHSAHFRLLGRHLTPLAAVVLFWIGFGLSRLLFRPGLFAKAIAVSFIALNIVSCLSLRFAARHQKDDYRNAANVAKTELGAGRTVWWNADRSGALFYHVPLSEEALPETVWLLRNPKLEDLLGQTPHVIVTSKPDIYDGQGNLRKFLETGNYRVRTNFPAFTIWEKPQN